MDVFCLRASHAQTTHSAIKDPAFDMYKPSAASVADSTGGIETPARQLFPPATPVVVPNKPKDLSAASETKLATQAARDSAQAEFQLVDLRPQVICRILVT